MSVASHSGKLKHIACCELLVWLCSDREIVADVLALLLWQVARSMCWKQVIIS